MPQPHRIVREGIIAGLIGATAVAVWFLIVDTITRRPFYTPAMLGNLVASLFDRQAHTGVHFLPVAGYTVVHYALFALAGVAVALVIHRAEREPTILALLLILFVAFEVGFYGLVAILSQFSILGSLAWYQVMVGNLLAAVLMGSYVWRAHPALTQQFANALDGQEH